MSGHDDIEVRGGGGELFTFVFDKQSGAWCSGEYFRLYTDGHTWHASLVQPGACVDSLEYDGPQPAFDELRYRLRIYAVAAG